MYGALSLVQSLSVPWRVLGLLSEADTGYSCVRRQVFLFIETLPSDQRFSVPDSGMCRIRGSRLRQRLGGAVSFSLWGDVRLIPSGSGAVLTADFEIRMRSARVDSHTFLWGRIQPAGKLEAQMESLRLRYNRGMAPSAGRRVT